MIGDLVCSNRCGLGPRPLAPWRGGRGPRWHSWGDVCSGLGPRRAGLPRQPRRAGLPRHGRWAINLGVVARRGGSRRREGTGAGPGHGRIPYQRLRRSSPRPAGDRRGGRSVRRAAHQQAIKDPISTERHAARFGARSWRSSAGCRPVMLGGDAPTGSAERSFVAAPTRRRPPRPLSQTISGSRASRVLRSGYVPARSRTSPDIACSWSGEDRGYGPLVGPRHVDVLVWIGTAARGAGYFGWVAPGWCSRLISR